MNCKGTAATSREQFGSLLQSWTDAWSTILDFSLCAHRLETFYTGTTQNTQETVYSSIIHESRKPGEHSKCQLRADDQL